MPNPSPNRLVARNIALALLDPFIWTLRLFGAAILIGTILGTLLNWPGLIAACGMVAAILLLVFFLFAHGVVTICVSVAGASEDVHPLITFIAKTSRLAATGLRGAILVLCFWMIDIYAALLRREWHALTEAIASNLVLSGLSVVVTILAMTSSQASKGGALAKVALGVGGYLSLTAGSALLSLAGKDRTLLSSAQTLFDHPLWFRDPAIVPSVETFFASNAGNWLWSLGVVPCIPLIFLVVGVATLDSNPSPAHRPPGTKLRSEVTLFSIALGLYFTWLLCSYLLAARLI
jgi:hypothetical protein